jgi:hypothetical protein
MILQGFNHFFHFFPPDDALELSFEHDLCQTPHEIAEDADAEDDKDDGESFPGRVRS